MVNLPLPVFLFRMTTLLGAFAIAKSTYEIRPVRPTVCISVAPTGRNSMKFETEDFHENVSRKYGQKWTKISGTLSEDLSTLFVAGDIHSP
jgi:hypothetical protein